ncbi:hypothetical protein ROZALSC1DRAFT_30049 [Rozella allomycis CSF55]|uniref:tRNA (adenine(58)-N(1))-methyltransferase catalytic subunit TRM61 n=1 Tax=Rozella allomycis (strain CSF55) TaxID=988480 RepID=A0A075ARD3_ROZAC|nr:tRNA (adenine(58)-N(1))-methyltransferase catalytic subunit GCD14-like protein [Rozella allomycis CSF55]RKP18232.1 hypothetical protein ROZALSC1DRAFT_30049 [Rozella allomycis CSF55]|eukprot:EPZ32856.1 tRNA (adenine(58)-N(1))-methyltransferase catalytic subunit GCD14-like protein [Rozella allomycis CSF55]
MVVGYSPTISEGDLVILYFTPENVSYCTVKKDERVQTRKGHFSMNDMIGQPYGTKIRNTKGDGFVYLLHPTPELWTLVLKHRTQILYFPDIAFITTMLDLKNGSVVVESGTGSGSFSHSLIRTIAPQGHLYTFEYHEQRANAARQEFEEHKLTDFVTIEHRDVCTNGFDLKDKADAVFLDLPSPWEAIETSKEALRKDKLSKICCFSPCIEQVQKTVLKLNELGFKSNDETI